MRILVTNDDGIDAPGIRMLMRVARGLTDDVWVVAPAGQCSGTSAALTLDAPLRVNTHGPKTYAVTGTPVDCLLVALGHLLAETPPDLVLSGVNRGPNLGLDVYYSGTVAAAREAYIHGIPALALSAVSRRSYPWEALEPVVAGALAHLLDRGLPDRCLYNLNFPIPDGDEPCPPWSPERLRITSLGQRYYHNEIIARTDPRGAPYLWIGGSHPELIDTPGTDCQAVLDGHISLTPIRLDVTSTEELESLRTAFPQETP